MRDSATRMKTSPIPVQRTRRPSNHRVLTSGNAGKMIPVACIPLLREDQLRGGNFVFSFEMDETVEILMNKVNVRVTAYLVTKMGLQRFDGLDAINKSYEGKPLVEGGTVTPWFEVMEGAAYGENEILKSMGKHWVPGEDHNSEMVEVYNQIWNFRAKNRSPSIELRERLDTTLAPAFWTHSNFAHIVPDFDQAILDGEVALSIATAKLPIKGIGLSGTPAQSGQTNVQVRESGTQDVTYPRGGRIQSVEDAWSDTYPRLAVKLDGASAYPDIYAELQANGVTLSLANIELARKTQAFAALRRQYNMHDDYIIDLLMDGITIPDQAMKQPILIFDETVSFGMAKRYASDGDNLTQSVVNGQTMMEMRLRTPRIGVGGCVMVMVEITPEQLFERQKDPYLHALSVDDLPQFLRDTLDPEKVQVVKNSDVDLDHSTPTNTFGYGPLNEQWARNIPGIGGRYYRPEVDAGFDEDRQSLWAVETANPVLGEDFYLCTTMHYKPFVVTDPDLDHFKIMMMGDAQIQGNTVFGGVLIEATDDYDKVMAEAPTDLIEKSQP